MGTQDPGMHTWRGTLGTLDPEGYTGRRTLETQDPEMYTWHGTLGTQDPEMYTWRGTLGTQDPELYTWCGTLRILDLDFLSWHMSGSRFGDVHYTQLLVQNWPHFAGMWKTHFSAKMQTINTKWRKLALQVGYLGFSKILFLTPKISTTKKINWQICRIRAILLCACLSRS